jgi:hypothetical protein
MTGGHLLVAKIASGNASGITGGVAQLGERRLCKPEVIGSIPFTSTRLIHLALCHYRYILYCSDEQERSLKIA